MNAPRGRGRWARWAVAAVVLGVACGAFAQGAWSVQVVAMRDFREARAVVDDLLDAGYPAYTEFTMRDGLQYVRVRVGCTTERLVAEAWAELLRGSAVDEAVAVPVDGALPDGVACVAVEVGFRKPGRWALVSEATDMPVFEVEVGDHVAYLGFDGAIWRVWQETPPAPVPAPPARVTAARFQGRDVVRSSDGSLFCPGRLLGSVGAAAVVDLGDSIVACRPTDAGGGG